MRLSFNQMKIITVVISSIGFIVGTLFSFIFYQSAGWEIVYTICLIAWLFVLIMDVYLHAKHRLKEDEMSDMHEMKAGTMTLKIIQILLCIFVALAVSTKINVNLNSSMFISLSFFLYAVNGGFYLLFEGKADKNDAGFEN